MTCPKHADLSAYLDDVLPQRERERLAGHLANCPVCHGYLDQLGALRQTLQMLPSPGLGFDLAARLEESVRATPVRRPPPRAGRASWAPGGMAAGLALASGIWLGSLLIGGAISTPPATLRVFDPVPPGGLCAAPELCGFTKGMQ